MSTQGSTEHIKDIHVSTRELSVDVMATEPTVRLHYWAKGKAQRAIHLNRHRLSVLQVLLIQAQQALLEHDV